MPWCGCVTLACGDVSFSFFEPEPHLPPSFSFLSAKPLHSLRSLRSLGVKQCGIFLHFLNTQCCCFIALLSFSIELMMSFGESMDERRHAVTFWLTNVLLVSLCILMMGTWISSKHNTLARQDDDSERRRKQRRGTKNWILLSAYFCPYGPLPESLRQSLRKTVRKPGKLQSRSKLWPIRFRKYLFFGDIGWPTKRLTRVKMKKLLS